MIKRRDKFMPYVRRLKRTDRVSGGLKLELRVALIRTLRFPAYCLVQRGFPYEALAVGLSKQELKNSFFGTRREGFKKWSRDFKHFAQKQ